MIFVVVKVKVREGQNFEFQIKNPNEKISFEDGSLVVFVFKNLIGWNTELNLYNYLVELVVFWDSKCILRFKMYFEIQDVF